MDNSGNRIWVVFLAMFLGIPFVASAETIPSDSLSHIHGIAVDPNNPERILLATHNGLFASTADGLATRVSDLNADITALAVHPNKPKKLYLSGKFRNGENLGVMTSDDGGRTWRRISDRASGSVAFQTIAVSPVNPNILYGINDDLQVSRDGGVSWHRMAEAPERVFSISASSKDDQTLFAATIKGVKVSRDGGIKWQAGFPVQRPATMAYSAPDGDQTAFIYGIGLVKTQADRLPWETVSSDFQDRVIIGLAISPDRPNRSYALADTGGVMTSGDGGKTWTGFEGSDRISAKTINRGRQIYINNCQDCHGPGGTGERPDDPYAKDKYGFVAPALNDDGHAWHHPDRQLVDTILNGSERNKRMIAWKATLSRREAEDVLTYIKSLWNFRSLACQGARHMACMQ